MARALCRGAAQAGASVDEIVLNALDFRGCQACMSCKGKTEACALLDGLTPVLEAVAACDVLVMATAVYFGEVSGQLKCFIDRLYCFLTPTYAVSRENRSRLAPGKSACMVIAQGHRREDLFTDIFPRYAYFLNMLGFGHLRLLRQAGVFDMGAAAARAELLERARSLGADLALGAGEPDWTAPERR
jgi:multimeric flavodoxin WrbA